MKQQVGLSGFLERGGKCLDQLMRKLAHEADRIGDHALADGLDRHPPGERIKRGKQLIGRVGGRTGQRVEQGRLAGIRVTDQRNRESGPSIPRSSLGAALAPEGFELLSQTPDSGSEHPPVKFELGFPWTATNPDAAALALKVGPATHQPCGEVFEPGELDLQLAFVTARAARKDVENQLGPVDNRELPEPAQIALLDGRQLSIKDDGIDRVGLKERLDFLRLTGADEVGGIRTRPANLNGVDRLEARGARKTVNFRFGGLVDSRAPQRNRNQQAALLGNLGGGTQLSALS